MDKSKLRQKYLYKRNIVQNEIANELSDRIYNNLLTIDILRYKNIFLYKHFKKEVRTDKIIKYLLNNNTNVYLPICYTDNLQMSFGQIFNLKSELKKNNYGIEEPAVQSDEKTTIDCIIVPGIVFSKSGNRIGFGCGYYDKFLNSHKQCFKIGLCYEFQLYEEIPTESFDVPMDIIVTENRIIECRGENA